MKSFKQSIIKNFGNVKIPERINKAFHAQIVASHAHEVLQQLEHMRKNPDEYTPAEMAKGRKKAVEMQKALGAATQFLHNNLPKQREPFPIPLPRREPEGTTLPKMFSGSRSLMKNIKERLPFRVNDDIMKPKPAGRVFLPEPAGPAALGEKLEGANQRVARAAAVEGQEMFGSTVKKVQAAPGVRNAIDGLREAQQRVGEFSSMARRFVAVAPAYEVPEGVEPNRAQLKKIAAQEKARKQASARFRQAHAEALKAQEKVRHMQEVLAQGQVAVELSSGKVVNMPAQTMHALIVASEMRKQDAAAQEGIRALAFAQAKPGSDIQHGPDTRMQEIIKRQQSGKRAEAYRVKAVHKEAENMHKMMAVANVVAARMPDRVPWQRSKTGKWRRKTKSGRWEYRKVNTGMAY